MNRYNGRLGNNIIQLYNKINASLRNKNEYIHLPEHDYIESCIDIREYTKEPPSYEVVRDIARASFKLDIDSIKCMGENDLVIHVRSGDITNFIPVSSKSRSGNYRYQIPPVSYYTQEINNHEYNRLVLVCEDRDNPVVDKLLEIYPSMEFRINNLEDDMKLILSAKNILMSIGSFIPSLCFISKYVKRLILPNHQERSWLRVLPPDVKRNNINIYNYLNVYNNLDTLEEKFNLICNYQENYDRS